MSSFQGVGIEGFHCNHGPGLCAYICFLQYKDLQVCVQAASAKCQLINSPNSVPLDSFLAMESVVLSATGVVTPSSEKVWVDRVQQFLKQ